MAKTRKTRGANTSSVNPGAGKVEEKKPAQKKKKEVERTPAAHYSVTVGSGESALEKGKRASALDWPLTVDQEKALAFRMEDVCVLDGRAKYKFGQKQFVVPSAYNAYMADRYIFLSGLYAAVAQEYRDNPETDVWVSSAEKNKEKALRLAAENKVLETRQAVMEELVSTVSAGGDITALQEEVQRCTWENVSYAFGIEEDSTKALTAIAGATVEQIREALAVE